MSADNWPLDQALTRHSRHVYTATRLARLVCSLQRGRRANEETRILSKRRKKGDVTQFPEIVSRTFQGTSPGLYSHRPRAWSSFSLSLISFDHYFIILYIPRPTVRKNQRKCDKISHVILPSIILADPPRSRSNPLDHEKDPPPPSRGTENLENKRDGGKNHRKMGKTYRAQNFFPKHFFHLYPSCVSNCDSSSRFLLPPPPFFLLPLLLYSSRQSITGFTSFVCRDSITAAKRSMTRRHVGVARITKVDASSSSRVSRVPHRENHQSTNHPRNSFSKPNT